MKVKCIILMILSGIANVANAASVGFQQFTLVSEASRQVNASIWYPTQETTPKEKIGENIAFIGTTVVKNASLSTMKQPLVLLSHGYRGNWRNLNWLATALAEQGMIVAAVDHPGTTSFDQSAFSASKWWLRANDLVRLLDVLLADTKWQAIIDQAEISVVGHSLGGWSAMHLIGAQFDRSVFFEQCREYNNPRTCGLGEELGLNEPQPDEPNQVALLDKRITKAIILDLGLARSLSVTSLNKIEVPTLILAAGVDIGDLPQVLESGYLAEHMPISTRRYKVYEKAAHFSFIQLCKAQANLILEQEHAGDSIICRDGADTTREQLHQIMFRDIYRFLTQPI
ncbi:alpha/beta fold hydrolase [Motilimonas sp. 1_MG-2023]|uniref:alpha/beta hydrolase family protein n=1 Tax=Motilimonas sp. 1_MG-2023 TaxID=3062672 RepID=UPI0026E13274|nr:alpha/beta fold hydrolase [Motilimonas sp. 1_MG-2023]MDO6526219.1 alpha/beta fold hydrolase [Motilimonas sp. 1_MG-2023]